MPDAIEDPQFVPAEYNQLQLPAGIAASWLKKTAALINEIIAAQATWGANGLMQWLETVMFSERWCSLPNTYETVYTCTFKNLNILLHPDKLKEVSDLCRMASRIRDKVLLC